MRMGLVVAALLLVAGCGSGGTEREDPDHDAKLLEIAGHYLQFGRVDDETRWAPTLCRIPQPSRGRMSTSDDPKTHGRKLYYVFANDRAAYLNPKAPQPNGQALVKESWTPEPVELKEGQLTPYWVDPALTKSESPTDSPVAYLTSGSYSPYALGEDGKIYHAASKAGLFIMFKETPSEDNDEGWVYGTVTADGRSVTAAGRIASCMRCHTKAPTDRIFGLKH